MSDPILTAQQVSDLRQLAAQAVVRIFPRPSAYASGRLLDRAANGNRGDAPMSRMSQMNRSRIIALVLITGVPLGFWAVSFIDPAPGQDNCPLRSVSHREYLLLLSAAKRQDWTVWPGLSKGIFWPSDRWLAPPVSDQALEHSMDERLRRSIEALPFDHNSADAQLAAAHAVMRSIHAELVSVQRVGATQVAGIPPAVIFRYFIPQRRFAPLCIPCFVWWYTTIALDFYEDLSNGTSRLDHVVVLNGNLKYDPRKEQERNATCPELPQPSKPLAGGWMPATSAGMTGIMDASVAKNSRRKRP